MRFLFDPRVAPAAKVLAALALVYTVFPLDLVPDFIPVLGWLDDAGVLAIGFFLLARAWNRYQAGASRPGTPRSGEPHSGEERISATGARRTAPAVVDTLGQDVTRR